MSEARPTANIFISVAEPSADQHAARLVAAARDLLPGATWRGLTGPRLRTAGVETIFDFTAHAAMLGGMWRVVGKARAALRAAETAWRVQRPDLIVVMDSTALHLPMAARAKQLGIPVLYYVAPQTWASRAYRNKRLARDCARVACILPFEEEFFRAAGVNATYVGHPLAECVRDEYASENAVAALRAESGPLIAILPGTRAHVVDHVFPRQLEVIAHLRAAGVKARFAVSAAAADRRAQIKRHTQQTGLKPTHITDDLPTLLVAADLLLVASGTATLHAAFYLKPMLVMYDAGEPLRSLYGPFGRYAINTPHLALVNVLAGKRIVPEFMPVIRDTAAIARTAGQLLSDSDWRELMTRQLDDLVRPLEAGRPSERVCELIGELIGV